MIEVSHFGSSAAHDAFLEAHGLRRLEVGEPAARLPADVTHLSWQFPGEHCTECAAPDCHDSCDLFERGRVGRCKRFADGIVARWTQDPVLRCQIEVLFRPWGQVICVGNAWCVPRSRYAWWARWVPVAGRVSFALQSALRFLPARMHWKAADKLRGAGNRLPRLLNARAARSGEAQADRLLCIIGNPHPEPVDVEVSVSGFGSSQGGRSFRHVAPLWQGWNCVDIAVADIAKVIDLRGLFRVCLVPLIERPTLLQIAFIGFAARAGGEAVSGVGRQVSAGREAKKVKLVVLDLDNTLWDGVLIENPEHEYTLRPGVREVLTQLDQRGILLSVASKNNPADARRVLEQLGIWDLFLHPRIGWDPKSAGIREIVSRLNIGMDTVAFVDDSEFERSEVTSALPEVRAYDATELQTLAKREELQVPVTEESRQRRKMYREESSRQEELHASRLDYDAFLASCGIRLSLRPLDAGNLDRVHELVQRTNQLNFSGNRYTRQDLAALLNEGTTIPVVMACEDRFGSYGLVGFSLLHVAGRVLEMMDLMFSCRIQGKKVEHSYLSYLVGAANRIGLERLACCYNRTARNTPAARVFEDLRFARTVIGESRETYAQDCRSPAFLPLPVTVADEAGLEARLAAFRSVA